MTKKDLLVTMGMLVGSADLKNTDTKNINQAVDEIMKLIIKHAK